MFNIAKELDVFFNGRPADPVPKPIPVPHAETLRRLIVLGASIIKVDGKKFKVTVTRED